MPVLLALLLTAGAHLNATVENRFAAWIEARDHSIASLSAVLGPELQEQRPRDLGFRLRRVDFNGDGQFLIVTAVVLDGTVLYVQGVAGSAKWKRAFDRARLLQHLSVASGARNVEVPAALAAAYERLFFPYDELMIGWNCGWTRKPAPGRTEIEQLVRARRFDLIENILRGGNPEGRVYAAQVLDERELTRDVRSLVDAVFASPLRVRHCSSDVIRFSPAADLRRR